MFLSIKNVLNKKISDELQEVFLSLLKNHLHEKELHFSRAGRYCFENMENGHIYMRKILKRLLSKVDLFAYYADPVIHHSFLLAKMPGGVATRLHQDRPYWSELEHNPASMATAWFSLSNIHEGNGSLLLNRENQTDDILELNSKPDLLPHFYDSYTPQQQALTIPDSIGVDLKKSLEPIPVGIGDLLFFDAYEPHCATMNASPYPRLAFKIVFGEQKKLRQFYKTVEELLE